ncbi:MAG: phosphonopyruvate decarboxylase [Eubacteriales bacterium]|mgnify:CR=1 FL=1|nr:phosphonopyruvate decarboxylase [Eubacteriales bacterium]
MDLNFLKQYDFFTGVPDSLLSPVCSYLISNYGISKQHIIAANEGNAVALAAGYHLSTGKVPVVYLQNSGIGNIINPVASLMNDKVYGIPCIFLIGWRGEPGVHDEPQHIFQGEVTMKLLEDMDIKTYVISKETSDEEFNNVMKLFQPLLDAGKQIAFVVKKDALHFDCKVKYQNQNTMTREEIIKRIVNASEDDIIISTTGKTSRELFEIRENNGQGHEKDFLTVGSMGHSSSIAFALALQKPDRRVWCIDGDGAALMHMGAMAIIGTNNPNNFVHIIINNAAHESVGGMPTVAGSIDMCKIAEGCGYPYVFSVSDYEHLDRTLLYVKENNKLAFIEAKADISARADLGRPSTTAKENKNSFMKNL